ncbi:MAG TPA: phasin family protein [Acidisoma sp.]|uniref:phasin family protein n=1 Tax=Acidisoma sp. TaxID=1872115 RepID=UPI002CEEA579|nr:phasin family protein [Acidisoma sp.]HTI03346.1 phasin family protein [Acidisoma sp.]
MARARTVAGGQAAANAAPAAEATVSKMQAATSEAAEEMKEAAVSVADEVVEAAGTQVTKAASGIEASQLQINEGITKTMKTAEEVVAFSQGNVEALIKSGQIWSAGMQDLSKQMASSMQASYEEAMAAFKAMTSVKSLKEAVDLQVGFARSAVEKSMTESSKYTDASIKLAEQAIAPISSRMTMAVEKFSKTA